MVWVPIGSAEVVKLAEPPRQRPRSQYGRAFHKGDGLPIRRRAGAGCYCRSEAHRLSVSGRIRRRRERGRSRGLFRHTSLGHKGVADITATTLIVFLESSRSYRKVGRTRKAREVGFSRTVRRNAAALVIVAATQVRRVNESRSRWIELRRESVSATTVSRLRGILRRRKVG